MCQEALFMLPFLLIPLGIGGMFLLMALAKRIAVRQAEPQEDSDGL